MGFPWRGSMEWITLLPRPLLGKRFHLLRLKVSRVLTKSRKRI